jgi:hypothetical protein
MTKNLPIWRSELDYSRAILSVTLATAISLLLAHPATAQSRGQGSGGVGAAAAVGIEAVHLINQTNGDTLAEISGGGFLGGSGPSVSLDDGTELRVDEASETMILATIPKRTRDGDYTLRVSTGDQSKQNAATSISLGGGMTVSCIDWFRSGPGDEHVHTEVHVVDENGDAVIGAVVTWTAKNDSIGVYQTNVSPTYGNDGHANGQGCENPVGSGVTEWFCCIGAAKWDGEEPGASEPATRDSTPP